MLMLFLSLKQQVSIRLHYLTWHSNGSIKSKTLEFQSNGLGASASSFGHLIPYQKNVNMIVFNIV